MSLLSGLDRTTPVAQLTNDGVFVSHQNEVWLYRIMPNMALQWEDRRIQQMAAGKWMRLFAELSETSHVAPSVMRKIKGDSGLRQFHIMSPIWDYMVEPPPENSEYLKAWQRDVFKTFLCHNKLVAVGVKLRRAKNTEGAKHYFKEIVDSLKGKDIDLVSYNPDKTLIGKAFDNVDARIPTIEEARQMEFWWNHGKGSDASIFVEPSGRSVTCDPWPEGLEFSAMIGYDITQMDPEDGLWLNDVFTAEEGCVCISARGHIYPKTAVRNLFRRAQRKAIGQIKETQSSHDELERLEDHEQLDVAETLEEYFRGAQEPLIRDFSIVFARRNSESINDYRDLLLTKWGIDTKVVEQRQMEALEETLPCGRSRFMKDKVFAQDLSVGLVAASGITAFNKVGDDCGAWVGVALHDMSPVFIDPAGSAKKNTSPTLLVVGEPGSGKTFFLQLVSTQAATDGYPVVVINPKPADSLEDFAEMAGGTTIKMAKHDEPPGNLDPFRFANSPAAAADILTSHISSVLTDASQEELHRLEIGLSRAAARGAQCAHQALQNEFIPEHLRVHILTLGESDPLFGLGLSPEPLPRLGIMERDAVHQRKGSLTLLEFSRAIDLPLDTNRANHTPKELSAMAAVRLVCRFAMEQMHMAGGGVLVVDEAHVLMGTQEGRSILNRLGREGRSQAILPILSTQRLHDVLEGESNLRSYLGRVLVLKATDPQEVDAAMSVLGLEATQERREWLENAGAKPGQGSLGFFRDLEGRASAVMIGPVPPEIAKVFSTNLLDRRERKENV